jgi:phenylacetate-CoA ligase
MYSRLLETMRSDVPGQEWPALPDGRGRMLLSLLYQFEKMEYLEPEWVATQQFRQARALVAHAAGTSPWYRDRLPANTPSQFTADSWAELPILTRAELQQAGDKLLSTAPPKGHEKIGENSTSGSTGMPVKVYSTSISRLFWTANTIREKFWRQWDTSGKLAVIRPELKIEPGTVARNEKWGAMAQLSATGPAVGLNVRTPVDRQLQFLREEKPDYLLSLPTNLRSLVEAGADFRQLKGIGCYGELLEPQVRQQIEAAAGVTLFDTYSSVEVGYVSLQCSEGGSHHVLSDTVLVEVVDDEDKPCQPGATGRVLVTVLHSFLAPLIRYELGDYAVAGGSCSCGRSYPVLDKILGRKRNMIHLPDGSQHWPSFSEEDWAPGIPLRQFQMVQTSLQHIDVNLVAAQTITPAQEESMRSALQSRFQYPFDIEFHYHESIARSAGGKFEDFVSRIES